MARQDVTDPEATRIGERAENSDTGQLEDISPSPGGASVSSPAGGGPRIVINPTTFRNKKDALCVAFNEAFRVVMEDMQFDPVAEPTERQRRFFSDTAYAGDETQLRRTILARICTFDTSVKDPTDEQLEEAVEFLDSVMEAGIPQNEWEQSAVQRIRDVVGQSVGARREDEAPEEAPPEDAGAVEADIGGGDTDESEGDATAADVDRDADGNEIDHAQDVYAQDPAEASEKPAGTDLTRNGTLDDAAQQQQQQPAGRQPAEEGWRYSIDWTRSNDVSQFDPYAKRRGQGWTTFDDAVDIIGPMALKRGEDDLARKAPGAPGAWDGSSRLIGPRTRGTYNSRSPNFSGGSMSPGSWDGSSRQIGPRTKGTYNSRSPDFRRR